MARRSLRRMSTTDLMKEIETYTNEKYQITLQFWGQGNNNVYIQKSGVDLYDTGSLDTPRDIIIDALEWLRKVNPER